MSPASGKENREESVQEPDTIAESSSRASEMTTEKGDLSISPLGENKQPEAASASSVNRAIEEQYGSTISLPRFIVLSIALSLGFFLAILDSSIVATSLYAIAIEFDEIETINWVALAYTLAYLSCAVLFARISDVVGRRTANVAAYVIFIAFSLACGWSTNLGQLIAFRAMQGVGGSGLYSLSMILLPEISPLKYQAVISALVGVVLAMAGVLGPVLGGVLTQYASWRWVFWINGPVGGVAALVFYFAWPDAKQLPPMERRKWKEVDFVGSFLLITAAVLIVFPFQNSGADGGQWNTAVFIAPLVLGVLSLGALFIWQWFADRRWKGRMAATLPMVLLRNRVYLAAIISTCLMGFPYFVSIYAFPTRFQVVNGKNPLQAGLMLLPMLAATAIGGGVAGAINGKKNVIAETLAVSTGFMILGAALETTAGSGEQVEAKVLGFLVFIGLGFGLSATCTTMIGMLESPVREHATAQGIIAQVRVLGGSIGIAASSAILGVKMRTETGGIVAPDQLTHSGSGLASLAPEQQAVVRRAYTLALREDMIVCCALLAVCIICAVFVYRRDRVPPAEMQRQRHQNESARVKSQGVEKSGVTGGEEV